MIVAAPPRSARFSKGDLSRLSGVPENVLTFWLRAGLLVPVEGGDGRGSHRRFDRMQVSLAAILREMHAFGANITTLNSFAEFLRPVMIYGETLKYDPGTIALAAYTERRLARFRAGYKFKIWRRSDKGAEPVDAVSEQEIAEDFTNNTLPIQEFMLLCKRVGQFDLEAFSIYADILEVIDTLDVGLRSWLLWNVDGKWASSTSTSTSEAFSVVPPVNSAMYIGVSSILKMVWNIDYDERERLWELRREERLEVMRLRRLELDRERGGDR